MRKLALIVIPLLLISGLACSYHYFIVEFNPDISMLGYWLRVSGMLFSLGTMFILGTFRSSKWVWGAYLGLPALCIGMLFKIMHWPGANLLCTLSPVLIAIAYTFHFISKSPKRMLDWLKIIYVVLAAIVISLGGRFVYFALLSRIVFVAAAVMVIVFYVSLIMPKPDALPILSNEDKEVFR